MTVNFHQELSVWLSLVVEVSQCIIFVENSSVIKEQLSILELAIV